VFVPQGELCGKGADFHMVHPGNFEDDETTKVKAMQIRNALEQDSFGHRLRPDAKRGISVGDAKALCKGVNVLLHVGMHDERWASRRLFTGF
jgi:hypothetical protein